jgi:TRAP transporter TAXI family solute receptor
MRHGIFVAIAASLGLIAFLCLLGYLYERPTVLRIAVEHDSDDHAILAAAAQKFAHDHESLRLKLLPAGTVAEAAKIFEQGQADLAVVRTDIAMPSNGQSVLIMRKDLVILVAPSGSELHSIGDLKGHRLGVLNNTPLDGEHGQPSLVDTIFAQYDVPRQAVTTVPLTLDSLPQAMKDKRVDAVLAVGVPDTGVLAKVIATTTADGNHPVFIPISEAKAIAARSPFYESSDVVRGLFGGTPPRPLKNFETLSVGTRLVAQSTLKDDTVTALTKLLLMVRPVLALRLPIANRIEAPSTDRGEALPIHPGAAAYLDDDEESFFDKYSDAIYIGALCLSAFGSAAAALASRFNRRPSDNDDVVLARLVAIVKDSRDADPQHLEALEAEADELLAKAFTPEAMRLKFEGQRVNALGIAFEHARHALTERRKNMPQAQRGLFEPRVVPGREGKADGIAKKPSPI